MNRPLKFSLGFSPCPNDCFIFDALVHHKINTQGFEFDIVMADVEELNRRAFAGKIDITKLSYHAFAHLTHSYTLLDAGSALGFGVGPLLISRVPVPDPSSWIPGMSVAIPGKYTTANFLFSLAFPEAKNKKEMLFSDIEDAVLSGQAGAGVIIHENRFTYEQKGLKKIIDLGEWWEKETGAAIPLGGIVMKRDFPGQLKAAVNRLIRESIQFAFANPHSSFDFVKRHAQEMDEEVRKKHIELYVNDFSADLGSGGRKAVMLMLQRAKQSGMVKGMREDIFLEK